MLLPHVAERSSFRQRNSATTNRRRSNRPTTIINGSMRAAARERTSASFSYAGPLTELRCLAWSRTASPRQSCNGTLTSWR